MDLIETIILGLVSSVTGFVTYFVGYNRNKKETETVHLDNLQKSIEIYQTIIEDLKKELTDLNGKVDSLSKKVDELLLENHNLKLTISKTTRANTKTKTD
jgi:peptidoglycan hydrolase CwlO-like protein